MTEKLTSASSGLNYRLFFESLADSWGGCRCTDVHGQNDSKYYIRFSVIEDGFLLSINKERIRANLLASIFPFLKGFFFTCSVIALKRAMVCSITSLKCVDCRQKQEHTMRCVCV